ncbi:hypothetical protein MRX96_050040 [Rhipicephalus microplus]
MLSSRYYVQHISIEASSQTGARHRRRVSADESLAVPSAACFAELDPGPAVHLHSVTYPSVKDVLACLPPRPPHECSCRRLHAPTMATLPCHQ